MVRPPRLAPGDPVALVTPSGPADPERRAAGMAVLSARYQVLPRDGGPARGYLAAPDGMRLAALSAALSGQEARAALCVRGGYGLLRIASDLPVPRVPAVGFSDATVLHAVAYARGVASVHGPVVTQLPRLPPEDLAALFALLEDPAPPAPIAGLSALTSGRAEGPLFGGNLTVLCHLVGTPLLPDLSGTVLLLEDVDEAPYRIDRMLTQLVLSGALDGVAGFACGEFVRCGETREVAEVLYDRLAPLGRPVVIGLPVGHGDRNRALPLGARAALDAGRGVLELRDGAVA